jgi:sulfofructose kinase
VDGGCAVKPLASGGRRPALTGAARAPTMRAVERRLPLPRRDEARFDVVGLGEISVDDVLLLDEPLRAGGKARVRRRDRLGGGQVATAMVAARRLGLRAALIGKVGDDAEGARALVELREEGVDVCGVRVGEGATHSAVIAVDGAGERTVLYHDDLAVALSPDELLAADVVDARVLHVDGSFPRAAVAAARMARAAGTLVSCDLDSAVPLTDEILPLVDLCIVSAGFPTAWSGERAGGSLEGQVRALAARTASGIACVTLGAEGAAAWDGERLLREPAFPTGVGAPWVDSTACGDTFRAGFLAAFLDGAGLRDCLRYANAAAALKGRDLGRRGCPRREEVDALVAAHRP